MEQQTVLNIIIAVCVVLLTLVFYAIYRLGSPKKKSLLLTGICDSGKTLIFSRIVHEKFVNTHTSIKENSGEYTTSKGNDVEIVDIPGHERLRYKFLDQYRKSAKAVIFVIDSLTIQKEIRDVAEQTIRETRSHSLKSIDGTSAENNYIGDSGVEFKFEQVPTVIDFDEGFARNKDEEYEEDLESLKKWITSVF